MQFQEAYQPFRALGSAWKVFLRAPLTILVGGVLLFLTNAWSGTESGVKWRFDRLERLEPEDWDRIVVIVPPLLAAGICIALALWLFRCLLLAGFPNAVERVLARGQERVGDVFDPRGQWLSMVGTTFLTKVIGLLLFLPALAALGAGWLVGEATDTGGIGAAVALGGILIYAPIAVYVWLGVSLAPNAVALEGFKPLEALGRSWSLVAGNRLWLLLYFVVLGVFSFIGVCACCIGVLLTSTLAETAQCESYLRLVRTQSQGSWWIDRHEDEPGEDAEWRSHDEPPTGQDPPPGGEPPPPRTDTDYV